MMVTAGAWASAIERERQLDASLPAAWHRRDPGDLALKRLARRERDAGQPLRVRR